MMFDHGNQSLSRKPRNPGKCRGVIRKPESHDQNFSGLHGFLLEHFLLGWGVDASE
jgi:hypothetical protein